MLMKKHDLRRVRLVQWLVGVPLAIGLGLALQVALFGWKTMEIYLIYMGGTATW